MSSYKQQEHLNIYRVYNYYEYIVLYKTWTCIEYFFGFVSRVFSNQLNQYQFFY